MSYEIQLLKKRVPKSQRKEVERLYKAAVFFGVRRGLFLYIDRVARKTGRLRRNLVEGLTTQINKVRGFRRDIIRVEFPFKKLRSSPTSPRGVAYAQYHVKGWNNQFGNAYRNPTTIGTRPIDPNECMKFILRGLTEELKTTFQPLGIDYRKIVNIRGTGLRGP